MNSIVMRSDALSVYKVYARAVALRKLDGKRVHFDKGVWPYGENERLENGTHVIPFVPQMQIGWQSWRNGEPGESDLGLLSEGFRPRQRRELGDLDKSLWERNPDGTEKDPWVFTNLLPLIKAQTNEIFTYTTSSKGGLAAIGALCDDFDAAPPGTLPLVALEASSYMHRNRSFGRIWIPVFTPLKFVEAAPYDAILAASRGERIGRPSEASAQIEPTSREEGPQQPEAPPIVDAEDGYAGPDSLDDIDFS